MRKGRDGGKNEKKTAEKKEEKTDENSGQQSSARTPTAGTPHARANILPYGQGLKCKVF